MNADGISRNVLSVFWGSEIPKYTPINGKFGAAWANLVPATVPNLITIGVTVLKNSKIAPKVIAILALLQQL